ncbi:MAG: helicase-related protein [Hyphomicrobium sp.]
MRVISPKSLGAEFQELKEAVCDAIINLTTDRVSGRGETGAIVYGRSPKRAFVAGLLLPRFDERNVNDETSDIRISTLGIDLLVGTRSPGLAELRPRFATYIRVFPTWAELQDRRYGLDVDFALDPTVEQTIKANIRAERARDFAAEDLNRRDPKDMPAEERRRRQSRRAEIRREVTRQAYSQFGIVLSEDDVEAATISGVIPQTSPNAATETRAEEADEGANSDTTIPSDLTPVVDIARLRARGRTVPHGLLRAADIPIKWQRIDLDLPPLTWDLALGNSDIVADLEAYNARLRAAALASVQAWRSSPEGTQNALRDVQVNPADVENQAAWERFLARARAQPPNLAFLMPAFDRVRLTVDKLTDFADPTVSSLRVTLENDNPEFSSRLSKRRMDTLFQASLTLSIPTAAHRPLRLDRVEPSYRFRHHMEYPGMGLNCGVSCVRSADRTELASTWAPRFVQPRIVPPTLSGIPCSFAELADDSRDCSTLQALPDAYRRWISDHEASLRREVREGLSAQDAEAESQRLEKDLAAQRKEARYIERGVELLVAAQKAARLAERETKADVRQRLIKEAIPWRAWVLTNRAFLRRDKNDPKRGWRLFQMAFVLAHIPTFASRMPEYKTWHDQELDETSASLLYFPTGGGKSEAFYGSLLFAMLLDRLRGKDRGITAMIRYPLRLLTLQQAQRLLRLLVHAELVRKQDAIGTWPFEIGFWVGKTNTPNRYREVSAKIPADDDADYPNDANLVPVPSSGDEDHLELARTYEENLLAYNKIPTCPVCGEATGLRRVLSQGDTAKRLAIFCFNASCHWNTAHTSRSPLPFILTDDAVYERAPSVVLGTVDKMAMLGQNTDTISHLLGMFGLSRWIGPRGNLLSPRDDDRLRQGPAASGYAAAFPAYKNGTKVFHDPFPSLIIQDEAHLLEESLGTFSGLFESLFEEVMARITAIAGNELEVARAWHNGAWAAHRTPKIIAATATVSDPERQLEVLYQRKPLRFPCPGPDIYHSFFAEPAPVPPTNADRLALALSLSTADAPEATAPWMRLYVSLMTNGSTHTMTAVSVLSAFHVIITDIWRRLNDPALLASGLALLRGAISPGQSGDWRRRAFDAAVAAGQQNVVLALVDLHRIGLTYVTNKKGGDQIMDALDLQVRRDHQAVSQPIDAFDCRLISGGIDMRTIQEVMGDAEREFSAGSVYPDINTQMRNVVATSAISHGVDVDRFNSMLFAGLPSDIAEYIQASSRVGRTHVGFVMLIPTPQSRRDRYVVETHDIFHRFLERMIAPPAAQRWAENALKRVTASVVQAWAMLREAEDFKAKKDAEKERTRSYDVMRRLNSIASADRLAMRTELADFMLRGVGFPGRGAAKIGSPVSEEVYRNLVDAGMKDLVSNIASFNSLIRLGEFWHQNSGVQPPMTSLRDVDEAGIIIPSGFDPRGSGGRRYIKKESFVGVMKAIRSQRGSGAETDRDGEPPDENQAA